VIHPLDEFKVIHCNILVIAYPSGFAIELLWVHYFIEFKMWQLELCHFGRGVM
jgi:hypothetical protein